MKIRNGFTSGADSTVAGIMSATSFSGLCTGLQVATPTLLGVVKVDNITVVATAGGVISTAAGGAAVDVQTSQILAYWAN